MSAATIVPLNLLVEFMSECADVMDFDSLLRVFSDRIQWILGFECLTLALRRGTHRLYWTRTRGVQDLRLVTADQVRPEHLPMLDSVFEQAAPGSVGQPVKTLASPLFSGDLVLGALCLEADRDSYTFRDARLVHHITQCLSSTIVRIDLIRGAVEESRRKDDFLALLSHELRNPLAPIMAAVHLLKRTEHGAASNEVRVIERQAAHMLRLIEDLLDVSRITRHQVILRRRPTEIGLVISRALELASPLLEQHGHHVSVAVAPTDLVVSADIDRLVQVVSNLLNNAARYTDPGGQIEVAARRVDGEIVIEVSDNGIGIHTDTQAHVFEQFVRAPDAVNRTQGGLGLGLNIVKTLTELHSGSVSVTSDGMGHGSTFSIRLPALDDDPVSDDPAPETMVQAMRPERILVVDDNRDAANLLSEILVAAGHEVKVAYDGTNALTIAADFHPSIGLFDIGLPVMSGYDLAAKLREKLGIDVPHLIALSGLSEERDRQRSVAAGFASHMVKPINVDELLLLIGGVSDRAQQ